MKIRKFNNWIESLDNLKKGLVATTSVYGEYVVCLESTDQIEAMREFVRAKSHIEVFDVNKLSENYRYETQGHSYCVLAFLCGEEALEYIGKQESEIPEKVFGNHEQLEVEGAKINSHLHDYKNYALLLKSFLCKKYGSCKICSAWDAKKQECCLLRVSKTLRGKSKNKKKGIPEEEEK